MCTEVVVVEYVDAVELGLLNGFGGKEFVKLVVSTLVPAEPVGRLRLAVLFRPRPHLRHTVEDSLRFFGCIQWHAKCFRNPGGVFSETRVIYVRIAEKSSIMCCFIVKFAPILNGLPFIPKM